MWYKVAAIILGSHCVRYASEWLYWNHCSGFISSIFSYNSPSCIGLRWIADSIDKYGRHCGHLCRQRITNDCLSLKGIPLNRVVAAEV